MSPAAIPVSFDRLRIASDISSVDITFSSIMVDTFAISSSNDIAIFPAAVTTPAVPAITVIIFFPTDSIFSPALSSAPVNTSTP